MRSVLATLGMLSLISAPAIAGRNANGHLIVHTNDAYSYSSTSVCGTPLAQVPTCEDAIVRTDKATGAVVWILWAFLPSASPAVKSMCFGIDYDTTHLTPTAWGFCGPAGTIEEADTGWPISGFGDTIGFTYPLTQVIYPFYYFVLDSNSGGVPGPFFCSTINPTLGYAAFFDDAFPPNQDDIYHFGCVKWYEQGCNRCVGAGGACCDEATGACWITSANCDFTWLGVCVECNVVNCPVPTGACCDPATGDCAHVTQADCPTAFVWHPEWTCVPNYCPLPVPTTPTTWGKIRTNYR